MKRILTIRHADGTQESICPKCGQVRTLEDNGETMSISAGNLNQQDNGDVWVCWNKNCDAYGIGFSQEEECDLELAFQGA